MKMLKINAITKKESIIEVEGLPPIVEIPIETTDDLKQQLTKVKEIISELEIKITELERGI